MNNFPYFKVTRWVANHGIDKPWDCETEYCYTEEEASIIYDSMDVNDPLMADQDIRLEYVWYDKPERSIETKLLRRKDSWMGEFPESELI